MVIDREDLNNAVNELEDQTEDRLDTIEARVMQELRLAETKLNRLMTIEQQRRNNFAKFILDSQQSILTLMQQMVDFSRQELETNPYNIRDDDNNLW